MQVRSDCVVIGAGLRLPPKSLLLFETVINAIHRAAPSAVIAFNTNPEDTAEAAALVEVRLIAHAVPTPANPEKRSLGGACSVAFGVGISALPLGSQFCDCRHCHCRP